MTEITAPAGPQTASASGATSSSRETRAQAAVQAAYVLEVSRR